jgi:outer membrane lipoprotein-sorting protein
MRRKYLSLWAVLVLALAFAVVFAAGCGDDEGTSAPAETGSSPSAVAELTPQEIVDESQQAMQDVNSMSFTADMKLDIQGDPAKMSDPTAKQLLSDPITLHMEGSSSTEPQAADMDMTVSLMGQDIAMSMLADGNKAWVEYEDSWYAVPQENMKALESGDSGALPNEQLADMGLDPQDWNVEWELVGTETVDGAEVYHLTASPDEKTLADDLMKALNDPELYEKLGDPETAQQLEALKGQNAQQLKELQKALENVGVDLWIETESMYLRKADIVIGLNTKGMEGAEGVEAMTVEVALTMADFDEPVEVKAPAKAKDFEALMNDLVGGMMGGGMSL